VILSNYVVVDYAIFGPSVRAKSLLLYDHDIVKALECEQSALPTGGSVGTLLRGAAGSVLSRGAAGSLLSRGAAGSLLSLGAAGSLLTIRFKGSQRPM